MKAKDFLKQADKTMDSRASEYDRRGSDTKEERSMGKTVEAFNIITGHKLTESEGWLIMLLLKQVRQWGSPGYHSDSAIDAVSYAALLAESLSNEGGTTDISAAIAKASLATMTKVMDSGIPSKVFGKDTQPGMHDPLYNNKGIIGDDVIKRV